MKHTITMQGLDIFFYLVGFLVTLIFVAITVGLILKKIIESITNKK
jgi:hypothetical protein